MTDDSPFSDGAESDGLDWLAAELEDTLDEDYELELSEPALSVELRKLDQRKHPATLTRAT
jgi:hypothetical protein